MAERRQAYTGSLGSTPSASTAPEGADAKEMSTFDKLANQAMANRGFS